MNVPCHYFIIHHGLHLASIVAQIDRAVEKELIAEYFSINSNSAPWPIFHAGTVDCRHKDSRSLAICVMPLGYLRRDPFAVTWIDYATVKPNAMSLHGNFIPLLVPPILDRALT